MLTRAKTSIPIKARNRSVLFNTISVPNCAVSNAGTGKETVGCSTGGRVGPKPMDMPRSNKGHTAVAIPVTIRSARITSQFLSDSVLFNRFSPVVLTNGGVRPHTELLLSCAAMPVMATSINAAAF